MKQFIVYSIGLFIIGCAIGATIYRFSFYPTEIVVYKQAKIPTDMELLVEHIKKYEDFSPKYYVLNGIGLQGYGHRTYKNNSIWTEKMATDTMLSDLNKIKYVISTIVPQLSENKILALTSLSYHIGIEKLVSSNLFNAMLQKDKITARWLSFSIYKGEVHDDFLIRRSYEVTLWNKGDKK